MKKKLFFSSLIPLPLFAPPATAGGTDKTAALRQGLLTQLSCAFRFRAVAYILCRLVRRAETNLRDD